MDLRLTPLFFLAMLALVADLNGGAATATAVYSFLGSQQESKDITLFNAHRKSLRRVECDKSLIQISQSPTLPLPNGIPTYTVEITNTCVSGCNISNIHVDCGMFSSATLINPRIFKRLSYHDCLVNDGSTLHDGQVISFKYASTYQFDLSVSYVKCN